jgi:hypothetical protein
MEEMKKEDDDGRGVRVISVVRETDGCEMIDGRDRRKRR